ncbi:MAG: circadian clock protein KaiC [Methylococcales bacterium]|nr:MAG: circadian clock protein KaiC [Methylococcales bacterium]
MQQLLKTPTGINGLDEITEGGLPLGRLTLVCGGTGCGKTLLAMEYLVRGATQFNEPGVFMSFEEKADELSKNFASLGFDLDELIDQKLLTIDHVRLEPAEIEEAGEYDLEGLLIRLGYAIDSIGAKRVVLDTIEALFSGLSNKNILRSELRRLFHFLKDKGVTAIVTAEQGELTFTRFGLEEYVADCVIFLNHSVYQQIATRRIRIVKYRGSAHSTNEYPFLIDQQGFSVMPISSLNLDHKTSSKRISTGVERLDTMLSTQGYFRGSSILVSGTAGTGKSSLAAHFVNAACTRGERCLYFAFEESQNQIIRNMHSIGIDFSQWVEQGLLQFQNARATQYGLEMHLVAMHRIIDQFKPTCVVIDPISNLVATANVAEVKSMLSRLIDYLKMKEITVLCTDLTTPDDSTLEHTEVNISSLMDTWLLLKALECNGERNRVLYIIKSRGMAHSNQIREFIFSTKGIDLRDVYIGSSGVLTGSARANQEAKNLAEALDCQQQIEFREREIERKKLAIEAQILALNTQFEAEKENLIRLINKEQQRNHTLLLDQQAMIKLKQADTPSPLDNALADTEKGDVE